MLIIKAYINERLIDQVWIHNKGEGKKIGDCNYEIEIPQGVKGKIAHERAKGWMPLAARALVKILVQGKEDSRI